MIPFDVEPTGMTVLDRIFRRVRESLQSLAKAVTNDNLISVTFTAATTDTPVFHGLKAPVLTWEVVDKTNSIDVWRSQTVNPRPRETLILQVSGAPATVLIRVT